MTTVIVPNRDCGRCGRGIHTQHQPRCRGCHQGRGLCSACYELVHRAGHLGDYPPVRRRGTERRDCPHSARHQHGTPEAYVFDRCGCPPCRSAKARQNAAYVKKVYLQGGQKLRVDATGTRRRVQALMRLGWPASTIAQAGGWQNARAVQLLMYRGSVSRTTAARIHRVYDQLSMRVGPSVVTRKRAERAGWVPPLAWDDDQLDDPAAKPHTADTVTDGSAVDEMAVQRWIDGDHAIQLNHAERVKATRRLLAAGWSRNQVMRTLGVNGKTFARIRGEALTRNEAAA